MSVLITNVTNPATITGPNRYTVRINLEPVIAEFTHNREDGLAECLRKAAAAVDAARSDK